MRDVTVNKEKLLGTLVANKATHQADFEAAWHGYRDAAVRKLEAALASAQIAEPYKPLELHVGLSAPSCHTEEYDRAIEMLEWHTGDEITLSEHEFQQYVQDEWGWKGGFKMSNYQYTGHESPSASL